MARRGNKTVRKGKKGSKGRKGIVGYIYNPISQAIHAVDNAATATTNTVGKVVHTGLEGINTVGKKVSQRADNTIRELVPRGLAKRLTRRRGRK